MAAYLKSYLQALRSFFTNTQSMSLQKNAVATESEPNFYKIATQLRSMVQVLRFVGAYPLSEAEWYAKSQPNKQQSNNKGTRGLKDIQTVETRYDLKLKNTKYGGKTKSFYKTSSLKLDYTNILYSFMINFISTFSVTTFLCNIVMRIPFPLKLLAVGPSVLRFVSSDGRIYNHFLMATLGICRLLEIATLLLNCDVFVQWLNAWSHFEKKFHKYFEKTSLPFNFDICLFRNKLLIFYLCIPSILWISFGIATVFSFSMFEFYKPVLARLVFLWACYQMWCYALVEDVKVVIMLKTTVLASEQIRMQIQDFYQSGFNVTPKDVTSWRKLINLIRQQTGLAGSCLKFQQILGLAQTVIVCSLGVSYALDSFAEELPLTVAVYALFGTAFTCGTCFGRVFLKVLSAEKISLEELRIADHVLKVDDTCSDIATKHELKFLHNMLVQKTLAVNLGNYFALNKKLLLQVGVQVVTYLIVIMQFRGSKTA